MFKDIVQLKEQTHHGTQERGQHRPSRMMPNVFLVKHRMLWADCHSQSKKRLETCNILALEQRKDRLPVYLMRHLHSLIKMFSHL